MIPYGRQTITEGDIAVVEDVLRSDFLTQGPRVPVFESDLCKKTNARYAVAVNSATSALHLACLGLGLGRGDVAWTTPITFVASANCALYCGAKVDFVDIDPATWTMCPLALQNKIETTLAARKPLPKIIIPVHFAGQSADMESIHAIVSPFGIKIIEDAAHAIGAMTAHGPVGNCNFSDVTVFSFHPVKVITTGEGGAALTNCPKIFRKLQLLRSHGITRELGEMSDTARSDPWYYEQIYLGFNYRLTDIAAALGSAQIRRLDEFVSQRNCIAERYELFFSQTSASTQKVPAEQCSARHLYVARFEKTERDRIFSALRSAEIGVNLHYIPVYRQPYFRKMGFRPADFPNSESFYAEAISLPIFPELLDRQQDYIFSALTRALK